MFKSGCLPIMRYRSKLSSVRPIVRHILIFVNLQNSYAIVVLTCKSTLALELFQLDKKPILWKVSVFDNAAFPAASCMKFDVCSSTASIH